MKINVVGIGCKEGEITLNGLKVVKNCGKVVARSNVLCGLVTLDNEGVSYDSFDNIYETTENFDELNSNIARELEQLAKTHGEIAYVVDGSGTFDKAVALCNDVEIVFFPTLTKGATSHGKQGGGSAVVEISAYDLVDTRNIAGILAKSVYVFDVDSLEIATNVKLKLSKIIDDEDEIIFVKGDIQKPMSLYELDWEREFDENTGVYFTIKETLDKKIFNFTDLLNIMDRLRGDGGCPWDREQTHESLRMCVLEEAYEVAEAIDLNSPEKLCEEVGDVMLQTVHHAKIAEDMGDFDIVDVITELCQKLIDRHTHIFGKDIAVTCVEALATWETNKEKLKGHQTTMMAVNDVPKILPSIIYAGKIAKKIARTGFDFSKISQIYDKIQEEFAELQEAVTNNTNIEEELGDLFFAVANLSRMLGMNGELALTKTSQKFIARFSGMVDIIDAEKIDMNALTEAQWEDIYAKSKNALKI